MRVLILGCGNVGLDVAARLRSQGDSVVATTTTPRRVAELEQVADRALVLRGADRVAVAEAASGCDAVLVSVSPPVAQAGTVEQRKASYRDVLVESNLSAASACDRVVFCSSLSVYGDGRQEPGAWITEQTPRTEDSDPSPVCFGLAEDAALGAKRGAVLRLADVYGHARDIDFTARVKLAHEYMGGSVPFAAEGLLHRVHVEDVSAAVVHVLRSGLTGLYNCVPDSVPAPTNGATFDALADAAGVPRLTFRGEMATPVKPLSSAKLRATGFVFAHPDDPIA